MTLSTARPRSTALPTRVGGRAAGLLATTALLAGGLAVGAAPASATTAGPAAGPAAVAAADPATADDDRCYGECTSALSAYLLQSNGGERDWPDLHRGDRSVRVAMVQRLLNDRGVSRRLAVDGIYGPRTARAVRSFQRSVDIRVTGRMTDRTFERLVPLVQRGDRGLDVATVQRRLGQLGHPTAIDGVFGPRTGAAVSGFQADHGLARDRVVGPLTWFRLFWG